MRARWRSVYANSASITTPTPGMALSSCHAWDYIYCLLLCSAQSRALMCLWQPTTMLPGTTSRIMS